MYYTVIDYVVYQIPALGSLLSLFRFYRTGTCTVIYIIKVNYYRAHNTTSIYYSIDHNKVHTPEEEEWRIKQSIQCLFVHDVNTREISDE